MNLTSGKKTGTAAIIILIAICFIPAVAAAMGPGKRGAGQRSGMAGHFQHGLGIWRNPQLVQALELSDEQVGQLKEADFDYREERMSLRAELDGLRLQMDKAFSGDTADDTQVRSLAEKISVVKGKLFVQKIEARLMIAKLLNADQISKLKMYDAKPRNRGQRQGREQNLRRKSSQRSEFFPQAENQYQ
jgi:Spy/CpxP family protein refolding chaperone